MSDTLQQAISLIKAGKKQEGGKILAQIVKIDPQNELAWLWMVSVAKTKVQKQYCLERVLAINPANKTAQKALIKLKYRKEKPAKKTAKKQRSAAPPMTAAERNRILKFAGIWLILLAVVTLGGYFIIRYIQFYDDVAPLVGVCQGKRIEGAAPYLQSYGIHPAVGVIQRDGEFNISMYYIPREIQASSLAETEMVLCMGEVKEVFLENCRYTDNGRRATNWINRYYYKQDAKLVVAKTGQVIGVETFTGNAPESCDDQEWFGDNDKIISRHGSTISYTQVENWIRSKLIVQ